MKTPKTRKTPCRGHNQYMLKTGKKTHVDAEKIAKRKRTYQL